jgi:proliferating cell nuclear antigen
MKLVLKEPRYLKDSLSIIAELVSEVNIKIDKDKLELIAMDPANVAMVVFKILGSAFTEYDVDEPKFIGINLVSLSQVLKRAKPTDMLSLELDEEKNRLLISLRGNTSRSFNLSLLDVDENEQRVPNLQYATRVESSTVKFNDAIEDMDVIADSLFLGLEKDKFIIEADGNLSSGRVEITTDEETDIFNPEAVEVKSKYSIEYLKKLIKGSKLANTVSLQFGQDYPLTMEYKVIDALSLKFILAPRKITND